MPSAGPRNGSGDCLITLKGVRQGEIKGEATASGFEGWIEVGRWQWGLELPTAWDAPAAGASSRSFIGAPRIKTFSFRHGLDTASAPLLAAASTHEECTAELAMRKAGGSSFRYLKIKFERVFIASVDLLHDDDNQVPEEAITFTFGRIEYEYTPQGAIGGSGRGGIKSWVHDLGTAK